MVDNRGYGDSGGGGNVSVNAGGGCICNPISRFILSVVGIIGALAIITSTFAFIEGDDDEHDITEGYTMSVPLIIVSNAIFATIGICYAWRRMRADVNETSGDEENINNKIEPVRAAQPNMQPQTPLDPEVPNLKVTSYPTTASHSQTVGTTNGTQSSAPTFVASNNYQTEQASSGQPSIFDQLQSDTRV